MNCARDVLGEYALTGSARPLSETEVLAAAEDILFRRLQRQGQLADPMAASEYLRYKIGALEHEVFVALWLDNRHQIIGTEQLFRGTISGAAVYVREVAKAALRANAAAVIFSHNHPSGFTDPSNADREITSQLKTALHMLDVRVLDHIIVGAGSTTTSMAQRGLL